MVGAGSAEWNGVYNETQNASGVFLQHGRGPHSLYSYSGVWRLGVEGSDLAYVTAVESAEPPETGWRSGTGPGPSGKAPAPHLVAGH